MKIQFLNGPLKNREFSVRDGLVLSRDKGEEGDIFIEDPQASNPHAEIIKKKGSFYLQDLDSKNGTRLKGEINDLFALKPGMEFQIGETLFQVKVPVEPWSQVLMKDLKKVSVEDTPKKLSVIQPPLILKFKSGVQKGDTWSVYYGPRTVGSATLDLPLLEPGAPDIAFSLEPAQKAVLFKTLYPDRVLLNKEHVKQKKLAEKDHISFANTLIEVHYGSPKE